MSEESKGRNPLIIVLCIDVALVIAIAFAFYFYGSSYQKKIEDQNLTDIANVNRSSANVSSVYFQAQLSAMNDAVSYVTANGLSAEQTLQYFTEANSGNKSFELVGTSAKGYAAARQEGGFVPVDYTSASYREFARIFTAAGIADAQEMPCTQEFTDQLTARKSFALYSYLTLADASGTPQRYTLLLVMDSSKITQLIDLDGGYADMSTVIVNEAGDYVFGSSDFKSDNLFEYFYVFNNLSLDQKKTLSTEFTSNHEGCFYLNDSQNRPCAFVYTPIPETEWSCVSCMPLASFKNGINDLIGTLVLVGMLLVLLAFNVAWLLYSNHRFRTSAQREREASSAKTDFLSRMSHDIRTPLNVVIGSTTLARREDNPPETQGYLENIDRSGRFLLSLVNDILDLNKVESGKMDLYPAPYSLAQFRMNIESIIRPLCQEREIDFRIEGETPAESYLLDSVRFDQIFFNLLSNSAKFTPAGGHVTLKYHVDDLPDGTAELKLAVIDDGIGMSEEFQRKMFESFSQERESETAKIEGTGLGLAIVKSLVDLMGGTIEVESKLGQGTAFYLSIPAEIAPDQAPAEQAAADEVKSIAGKHVLLFEDNDVNAQIATRMLEQEGVVVKRASDGAEGLAAFLASTPYHYDAVLMDLRMPHMNGFEAARAIRATERDDADAVPIIAMTANAYDEDARKCLEAGMNAHLSKPVEPAALFSTLAREITHAEAARRH